MQLFEKLFTQKGGVGVTDVPDVRRLPLFFISPPGEDMRHCIVRQKQLVIWVKRTVGKILTNNHSRS